MKKVKYLLLVIMLINLNCAPEPSSTKNDHAKDERSVKLDEYFKKLAKIKRFNGGVFIKSNDEIVLKEIYSMADKENSSFQVDLASQFDIHSISKLMSKASVIKMEERGQINRNDKVSKYISDYPIADQITIQHLLDNQSGLPRELSIEDDNLIEKSPKELVELIKKEKLLYQPGSEKLYSNLGFELLYYIISEISGKSFVKYLDDEYFTPLNMNDTGAHFHLDKNNLKRKVRNHLKKDNEIIEVPNIEREGKNQARIYSTLSDLMKFIEEIKKENYRQLLNKDKGYIGWSGGGEGIVSHARTSINSNYDLVFFSNYDEIPFKKIQDDIEKIMTGKPYELPKEINRQAVKIKKETMQRYVGKYDMAEFNHHEFEFRLEDDDFVFYQNGERNTTLNAENDNTFFDEPSSEDIFIFRPDKGENYKLIYKFKGTEIVGLKK